MIRLIGYFFGIGAFMLLGRGGRGGAIYLGHVTKDLPDYEVLNSYAPPVTTRVHAGNGALMAEYARERRLYLPIQAIPDRVKAAFISAEDKNFYQASGRRRHRSCPRHRRQPAEFRLRPPSGRRLDDHPAGRQELPAFVRPDDRPQGQGSDPVLPHRAGLQQGPHSRTLSQRDLLRPELLRHRRRGAHLFRQVGNGTDRLPRRPISRLCRRVPPTIIHSARPRPRSSAATGSSTAWSRTAMSPRPMARKPRSSRSA